MSLEGVNDWLKAFSEILRYREDAALHIPSELCLSLSRHALDVFRQQLASRNLKFLFRYSALIIVYLLRRRAWQDDYLDPACNQAIAIKQAFGEAIQAIQKRHVQVLGGAVDIQAALKKMIEYIDRHGSGQILMFD